MCEKWLKKCSGKEGEKIVGNEGKSKLSGGAATESGYMWDYFLDILSLVCFRYFVCIVLYLEIYCSFIF